MRKIYLFIYLTLIGTICSQLSINSLPISLRHQLNDNIPIFKLEDIDVDFLLNEDQVNYGSNLAYRFGYRIPVDINFFDYASYDILDSGDRVYRLEIYAPEAYSINMIFNNFFIPEKGELFIYNHDYSHMIGAFTHLNNKSHQRFSISPVSGERIIIEYYEPKGMHTISKINIESVIHGYKDTFYRGDRGYNDSEPCHNNVNCAEAQPWNDEINSVVLTLTDGGTRLCSGAMINNVNEDFEMYFLTSETCLGGHEDWIFMFNYQSPNCENQDGPTDQTLSGASLLAHNPESDFALLKIQETPPEYFDVYFSGWDARQIHPENCVSIHHPVGDIKKISYHSGDAISDGWYSNDGTHWRIDDWNSGITEPGSYGAPLFNDGFHIVGQLHGGESSCDESIDDYYGKLAHSWDLGLSDWLDPNNTGTLLLDGIAVIETPDPQISYSDDSFDILIFDTETDNENLLLSNIGEEESILSYELYNSPFSKVCSSPDEANYYWIDSDKSDFHDYYWLDIDNTGSQVWFEDNDEAVGPFDIGFNFPFYNHIYSEFIISPNGWIGFGDDNTAWENIDIPSDSAPMPAILAFWDDLNPVNSDSSPDMSGQVKYYSDGNQLIVSYQEVVHWDDDAPYTFQIIIDKNGVININYGAMNGERNSATIGIQNENGQIAQAVAFNESYIHNFMRLSFEQAPNWLSIDNQNYVINNLEAHESFIHSVEVNGSLMNDGVYETYMHIESNATGPISIPVYVQVGYESSVGDINYDGLINVQDVVLLISIILGNYPPNLEADINQDGMINVLDAVLLVNSILDQ